jgi:glucose uptake protein GlcU
MDYVIRLLGEIAKLVLNPLIILGFTIATIFLFFGIAQMIWQADSSDLEKNRNNVKYGIIGLVVMFSVYGLLHLVLNTFGIPSPSFLP